MHCHTFSTELVHAGRLPDLPSHVIKSSLRCDAYFLAIFWLQNLNKNSSLNAILLQANSIYFFFFFFKEISSKFYSFVKEEEKAIRACCVLAPVRA